MKSATKQSLSNQEGAAVFGYYFSDQANGLPLADPAVPADVAAVAETVRLHTGQSEQSIAERTAAIAACMAELRPLFESL